MIATKRNAAFGLHFDDLEGGRYLAIPQIVPFRATSSASLSRLSSGPGT